MQTTIERPQTRQRTRRLPPYARDLAEARRKGLRPASGTVVVRLDTWPAKTHIGRLEDGTFGEKPGRAPQVCWPQVTIPEDSDPASFDFQYLEGLEVIVAHWRSRSASSRLKALLREILRVDPRMVLVFEMEAEPRRIWFVKSLSRGVEVNL